jgi:hypothetical protein
VAREPVSVFTGEVTRRSPRLRLKKEWGERKSVFAGAAEQPGKGWYTGDAAPARRTIKVRYPIKGDGL